MSILVTSIIDARHLGSYNGNALESSQKLTLQNPLQVRFVQQSGSHYYSLSISHSKTPLPIVPTNYTMIQYDNHHASPQLVDRDELRFCENEMLKYSYPQPIISTSETLDGKQCICT
ncbi:hypothetical protein F8M41_004721 [Gigaspora margarita]|uniref:Uncharacterized protein n=1 Tax=Gigaspora margarita TaxID=4874 RepID=A0A8H3X9B1_GIGMA|nr:hypothetical protein F8M41_004721 [Gigaspora margarita]